MHDPRFSVQKGKPLAGQTEQVTFTKQCKKIPAGTTKWVTPEMKAILAAKGYFDEPADEKPAAEKPVKK